MLLSVACKAKEGNFAELASCETLANKAVEFDEPFSAIAAALHI